MQLLVATGNAPLSAAMRDAARGAGYAVETAADGDELLDALRGDGSADLLVLDGAMTLPEAARDEVARRRGAGMRVLEVRAYRRGRAGDAGRGRTVGDGVDGGNDGATCDDVLTTPFSDAEFLAHLTALARGGTDRSGMIIRGDLRVDTHRRQAFYGNTDVPLALSPREYEALEVLAEANGRFMTFDEIVRAVQADGFFDQREIMGHALYSLEKKLRRAGFMLTQRGDRYRIW